MIDEQVRKLVCYGLERGLFTERDEIYVTNRILEILQLDEYNCDTVFSDVDLEETLKALPGDPSVRKLLKKGLRASVCAGKDFGGTGTQTLCVAEFQGRTADGIGFGKDTDTDSRSQEKEK